MKFLYASFCCFLLNILEVYNNCELPLLNGAEITASSQRAGRHPSLVKFSESSAWSAASATRDEHLDIDLGATYIVTSFAVRGRDARQPEWVSSLKLQYAATKHGYLYYRQHYGSVQIFDGNSNAYDTKRNVFSTPIIARYIRIHPIEWQTHISLKLELYGCVYEYDQLSFSSNQFISMNTPLMKPLNTETDKIMFRFRTSESNSVLIYSRGKQGDVFIVELLSSNKLQISYNLGTGVITRLEGGSLLDDSLWHAVSIERSGTELSLRVDHILTTANISGHFVRLNLDDKIYIGGIPFHSFDLSTESNFSGCMENLIFNKINVFGEVRDGNRMFVPSDMAPLLKCDQTAVRTNTLTFTTIRSHVLLTAKSEMPSFNISFTFRTFQSHGLLAYHVPSTGGFIKVMLRDGGLYLEIDAHGMPVTPFLFRADASHTLSDGVWHSARMQLSHNSVSIEVDHRLSHIRRQMTFRSGSDFYFAGSKFLNIGGYIGCMKDIFAAGTSYSSQWEDQIAHKDEVIVNMCHLTDRCNPNPCEHEGVCMQREDRFYCACTPDYTGLVCRTPVHHRSCTEYFSHVNDSTTRSAVTLDVDGSGPLPPFSVVCHRSRANQTETLLSHNLAGRNQIQYGAEEQLHAHFNVTYTTQLAQIERLLDNALDCKQLLNFYCVNTPLYYTDAHTGFEGDTLSWWTSRDHQRMNYWGGSQPGTGMCACGLMSNCHNTASACNCDAGVSTRLVDGGYLHYKEHIPVTSLVFGHSPISNHEASGIFELGPLICQGDVALDNIVTFNRVDANIVIRPVWLHRYSNDISFSFRTSIDSGTLFHMRGANDYVKIYIEDSHTLFADLSVDHTRIRVSIELVSRLDDDEWHRVALEFNLFEVKLMLDDNSDFVRGFYSPLSLHSYFSLGSEVDYSRGFTGCMRAFMLNGQLVDVRARALSGDMYGVRAGCVGKCPSSPCLNGGRCVEMYSSYVCECRHTAYKGQICADEIGVRLQPDQRIRYGFAMDNPSPVDISLSLGFTTTNPSGILMHINGHRGEYFTVMLTEDGSIRVVFDVGFERQEEIYDERSFATGKFHTLVVRRTHGGEQLEVQVDRYTRKINKFRVSSSGDVIFDRIYELYIGSNSSDYVGFQGCISRVQFEDTYPLKELFQADRPLHVTSYPSNVNEDFCGVDPPKHPKEKLEVRPDAVLDQTVYDRYSHLSAATIAAITLLVCVLLAIMLLVAYRCVSKHKGDYHTREDFGACTADDADEAVVHSKTGPYVGQMKELLM